MSGSNQIKTAFPVFNGYAPMQGPKALPVTLDFTATQIITFDLLLEETQGVIQYVQSIWVDNADNASPLTLTFAQTNQRIVVPANAQGAWPVIAPDQTQVKAQSVGGVICSVILLNVPLAPEQYGPVTVNANVNPAPYQAAVANSFNAIVTSGGTAVFAANAARRALSLVSDSSNIDPIRITVAGVPFMTLLPGQDWSSASFVPMGAIAGVSLNAGTTPTLSAIEFI